MKINIVFPHMPTEDFSVCDDIGFKKNVSEIAAAIIARGYTVVITKYARHQFDAHLFISSPVIASENRLKKKPYIFTMCETEIVEPQWVKAINSSCRRVFVPHDSQPEIFRNCGVTVPITVSAPGHSADAHLYQGRSAGFKPPFIWLTHSLGGVRKGADIAVRAFEKAFPDDAGHEMRVHLPDFGLSWCSQLDHPRIRVIKERFPKNEYFNMMRNANAGIYPTRGEGYGFIPREATLTGLPTIASRHLGLSDVDDWGWGIDIDRERYWHLEKNARWQGMCSPFSEPSVESAIEQMRRVYSNYSDALAHAKAGRDILISKPTSNMGDAILDAILEDRND